MNIIDNSGKGLAALGRNGDSLMAHVTPGEMVVPPVISDNTKAIIKKEMSAAGLDPDQYVVGKGMSINPITGQAEFGFSLKKLAKSVKKVVKKIAPIAAVIPGPWTPFAVTYQKGAAALRIAKGEGGLGDIMTVMAGGSQKVFGKDGALQSISSGDFKNIGGGFGSALSNIGQVDKLDSLGNVVQGETVFNPLRYGAEIGKTYGENQRQGYGGIFSDVGGADTFGGQAFNTFTSAGNPVGNIMNAAYTPGMEGGMMPTSNQSGTDGFLDYTKQNFIEGKQRQRADGQMEALHKDGSYYTMDEAQQYYNVLKETGQLSGPITQGRVSGKQSGQSVIGLIEDMIKGKTSNTPDHFIGVPGMNNVQRAISKNIPEFKTREGETGSPLIPQNIKNIASSASDSFQTGSGGGGLNAAALAMAALYGKVVKDAAKKNEGGLTDIRQSIRPDLNPAPVFAGFDLGVRKAAAFGGPIGYGRQQFNKGGLAAIGELDMRNGGESAGPGTGTSDDIPAMLSDGEFVMTAAANNGAGGFKLNKTKKGIELIASSKPNRQKGVDVMNKLMDTFEKYNASGSMA
tara:strand:- start:39 stop:1751 length:1713 start_codon:yes stop_codon:yes gene_type:complete